jgi:hypothetical protein
LIPSAEIKITASGDSPQNAGSDAGVWIMPLTNRSTIGLSYEQDFRQNETLKAICDQRITYIYVSDTDQSFSTEQLEQKLDWYGVILILPKARIYQVLGCA